MLLARSFEVVNRMHVRKLIFVVLRIKLVIKELTHCAEIFLVMCSLESAMADAVSKRAAPLEVSIDKEPASPVDGKKQPPPPPSSPASMDKKEKPLVVVLVCLWALLNAAIFAGYAISELILNRHPCTTVNNSAKNSSSTPPILRAYMYAYTMQKLALP